MKNLNHILLIAMGILGFSFNSFSQNSVDTLLPGTFNKVYSVQGTFGSTFYWECTGGTILVGQGSNTVLINWTDNPGFYKISVTETNYHGCEGDPVVLNVLLKNKSQFLIETNVSVCAKNLIQLTAPPSLYYKNAKGFYSKSIKFMARQDSIIKLFYVENNISKDSTNQNIKVNALPSGSFSLKSLDYKINDEIEVYNENAGNNTTTWLLNDSLKFYGSKANITFTKLGLNSLKMFIVNPSGCMDSVEQLFNVNKNADNTSNPLVEIPVIKLPTIFTPNKDGINDNFFAYIENQQLIQKFDINIYDRWGNQVFQSKSPSFSWDGSNNGIEQAIGVYVIKYSGNFNSEEKFTGTYTVNLSR